MQILVTCHLSLTILVKKNCKQFHFWCVSCDNVCAFSRGERFALKVHIRDRHCLLGNHQQDKDNANACLFDQHCDFDMLQNKTYSVFAMFFFCDALPMKFCL